MVDYLKEAQSIWNEFENEVIYKNRFFPTSKLIELLKEIMKNNQIVVEQGTQLYRARIYREDYGYSKNTIASGMQNIDNEERKFWGYDKDDCGAPSCDKATAGRSNPENIAYLYLADNDYTAVSEIRPFIDSKINVATFKVLKDVKILDFSKMCSQDHSLESTIF
jgi:hypothetical protein